MNPTNGGQLPKDVLIQILKFADLSGLNGCRTLVASTASLSYRRFALRLGYRPFDDTPVGFTSETLVSRVVSQEEAWSSGRFSVVRTSRLPPEFARTYLISQVDASRDLLLWQVRCEVEYLHARSGISGRFALERMDDVSSMRVKDDVLIYVGGRKAASIGNQL